tara:strand:- start:64 stop:447 length:384 start_codon:yes stop_codon:yes gene_type:complete
MNSVVEKDIYEIAEYIFSKPPTPKNSIDLILGNTQEEVHKSLLMFFTKGMKLLYGNQDGVVDLLAITRSEMKLVQQYFESIGIRLMTHKQHHQNVIDEVSNKRYLKDYVFYLQVKQYIFQISFDYLQ